MFKKQILNFKPCRHKVFPFKNRPDIIRDCKRGFLAKFLYYNISRILVSSEDNRQFIAAAETWLWVSSADNFSKFNDMADSSAIRTTGKQNHVRPKLPYSFDFFMRKTFVVASEDIHDNRASAKRGSLRAFAGHLMNRAGNHHLKTATR